MPASALDILHSDWEKEDKIINDLKASCLNIRGKFFLNDGEVQIHKRYEDRDADLILEIESEKSLEWYYEQYPSSKLEPESRIPYFVFDHNINNGEKLITIVTSNCYLNDELVYYFFKEYLKMNQEKIVYINKSIDFSYQDLEQIELNGGYCKNWYYATV